GPAAMPHRYDPRQAEERWTRWWEENRVFHARVDSDKPRFSMVIPPPNVTGVLHVGHALDQTLQDIFARWHRMQGKETLWLPGKIGRASCRDRGKVWGGARSGKERGWRNGQSVW